MHARRTIGALAIGALAVVACGDGDSGAATTTAPPATEAEPTTSTTAAAGSTIAVKSSDSDLGTILVGPDGRTIYGFTNDKDGQSNCSGTCADAWPPVIVDDGWTVGPGLDSAIFNAVTREDGSKQLVAGSWPLYYFSGDAKPGDLTGQGSGGVWFVVGTDGKLVKEQAGGGGAAGGDGGGGDGAASGPTVSGTSLGEVLVDEAGLTLYAFTDDEAGTPTCDGACADAWPPVLVDAVPVIEGVDPSIVSVVPRGDGTQQLKVGTWPLYRFAGDAAPGDVNGQGSGGKWFVVGADGKLLKEVGGASGNAGGSGGAATPPSTASGY
jgi:predicted lipoprotein with Yx(FWY)xxD motif